MSDNVRTVETPVGTVTVTAFSATDFFVHGERLVVNRIAVELNAPVERINGRWHARHVYGYRLDGNGERHVLSNLDTLSSGARRKLYDAAEAAVAKVAADPSFVTAGERDRIERALASIDRKIDDLTRDLADARRSRAAVALELMAIGREGATT